jgi:hypothetical protein
MGWFHHKGPNHHKEPNHRSKVLFALLAQLHSGKCESSVLDMRSFGDQVKQI